MFRTGKRHRLTSEAGKRNERGVDPTICEVAADRVAELLDDVRRRHGRSGRHRGRHPARGHDHRARPELPGQVAGLPIDGDRVVECLRAIGCEVVAATRR